MSLSGAALTVLRSPFRTDARDPSPSARASASPPQSPLVGLRLAPPEP
jgi:hypothetical protein